MASWCPTLPPPPLSLSVFPFILPLLVKPKYTWMNAVNVSGKAVCQAWFKAHPAKHNREQVEELKQKQKQGTLVHSLPGLQNQILTRDRWKVLDVNLGKTGLFPVCVCMCVSVGIVHLCGKNVHWLEQPQSQPCNHRLHVICNRNPSLTPTMLHPKLELQL